MYTMCVFRHIVALVTKVYEIPEPIMAIFFLILFLVSSSQSFSPLFLLLDLFPSEKILVSREILGGAYSTSAYFIARVIAELPLQILLTCMCL